MKTKEIINKIDNKTQISDIIYADIETILIDKKHYPYAIGWVYQQQYFEIIVDDEKNIMEYFVIKQFFKTPASSPCAIYGLRR
jgi:hypothetical protein